MPSPVQLTKRTSGLHYYRCRTCCEVFTLPEKIDARAAICDCEGKGLEYLGQAIGETLRREETRAACDARCTMALGPHCDCLCGGVNHGSGKTVRVEVIESIPRVRLRNPDEARARRAEYDREWEAVETRLAARYGAQLVADFQAPRWIDNRTAWRAIRDTLEARADSRRLRTHRNRIAALQKL